MSEIKLDIKSLNPLKGKMSCNLFENENIKLPLHLNYYVEIPLEEFDSGHDYVDQPTSTSLIIDWIQFKNQNDTQEKDWKQLEGKSFLISYEQETGEGSVYLGTEHCQFNSQISFLKRTGSTFEVEIQTIINFNIETVNLPKDEVITFKTEVEFDGFLLYDKDTLPSISSKNPIEVAKSFIELNCYQDDFQNYDNPNVNWLRLAPK
jgi:hypothetical protein